MKGIEGRTVGGLKSVIGRREESKGRPVRETQQMDGERGADGEGPKGLGAMAKGNDERGV